MPLLFRPYAELRASARAHLLPTRILETAAGTGVVTDALHRALPEAEIVATDLNRRCSTLPRAGRASRVSFRAADALDLPFGEDEFDLVVCQFGAMFFPDKVKGNAEARRVLRDGGHYLLAIWDAIERNPMSDLAHQTMVELFPDDPPMFMKRGPFSYHDPEWIERDLKAAGFDKIGIETVELRSRATSSDEAARGALLRLRRCASSSRSMAQARSTTFSPPSQNRSEQVRWARRVRRADVGAYRDRD